MRKGPTHGEISNIYYFPNEIFSFKKGIADGAEKAYEFVWR